MQTKSVLLVDAFADEPLGGVPIAVVPDATREQLRRVAGELGTGGAVTLEDDRLVSIVPDEAAEIEAVVAGCVGLLEYDLLDVGGQTSIAVDSDGHERERSADVDADRRVHVELPEREVEEATVPLDRLTPALNIDSSAIEDVTADLPVGRVGGFGGTLIVPVAFLANLLDSSPDRETLAALLAETETSRACAFTFDTLGRRTDLHVRTFDPTASDCERPASGVAVAACGRYLEYYGAFDDETERLRVESGHVLDRPGTVVTTLGPAPRVGGTALTALDGTITVPEEPDDDIIEL